MMNEKIKNIQISSLRLLSTPFSLMIAIINFLSIIYISYYQTQKLSTVSMELVAKCENKNLSEIQRLKYWTETYDFLPSPDVRDRVFRKLQYDFVNGSDGDDWDVLWSDRPPWKLLRNKKIAKHQKVNHFPGTYVLTEKDEMNYMNRGEFYNLPAFELPKDEKEFENYLKENPDKKIVEKGVDDHEVRIIEIKDIKPKKDYFYQEFLGNPFLIDGFAFDVGVFVLVTSFDPIRAYRATDDVIMRFCTEKFHPFDARNKNKFKISNNNKETPSFKNLRRNFKYSTKLMFENLISKQGFDVKKFWRRIDEAMTKAILKAERNVLKYSQIENHSMNHFFALMRFDFIFDEHLNPYLLEINKDPSTIYDHTIENSLKMVGGNSFHEFFSRFEALTKSNYKNLATSISFCNQPECLSCSETFCKICRPCMTPEVRYQLNEAFREHQNSANFKRVLPTKNHFDDEKMIATMTENNQIQMKWFKGKCEEDVRWC